MLKLEGYAGDFHYLDVSDIFKLEYTVSGVNMFQQPVEASYIVVIEEPDKSLDPLYVTEESFNLALEAFKKWCD